MATDPLLRRITRASLGATKSRAEADADYRTLVSLFVEGADAGHQYKTMGEHCVPPLDGNTVATAVRRRREKGRRAGE